jgi:hypothetical protein
MPPAAKLGKKFPKRGKPSDKSVLIKTRLNIRKISILCAIAGKLGCSVEDSDWQKVPIEGHALPLFRLQTPIAIAWQSLPEVSDSLQS